MTDAGALIIDGREVSKSLREGILAEASDFADRHGRKPGLAVIIVGADPASRIYVKQKAKSCADTGIHSLVEELPAEGGPAISEDLREFDRRKSEEAEKMSKLFESGEHEKKQQEKMDRMGEDLKDFKKRKPINPFGDG